MAVVNSRTVSPSLVGEFDLTYRPHQGEELLYAVSATYHHLDDRGLTESIDTYSGEMSRAVHAVAEAQLVESITWRNLTHNDDRIEWPNGFAYDYDWSRPIDGLLDRAARFPRDIDGWNVLLLMIDTHVEFDFPRSDRGGIAELKRVGDKAAHERGEDFVIPFAPLLTATFPGGERVEAEFVGLSLGEGAPCAVISSDSASRRPFEIKSDAGTSEASTSISRRLRVRLEDGVLQDGVSVEWVCVAERWINPVYSIRRLRA